MTVTAKYCIFQRLKLDSDSTVYYASETSGGFSETILSDSETTGRTRYHRAILQKTWFDLHNSSVF